MTQKDNMPMVSVIIPAYNSRQTIERACRSVLTQSYPNVELIVVNDGSVDGTAEILEALALAHPNLKCFHQQNSGVSEARNTGLCHANGAYIVFLDADDELIPDSLNKLVRTAAEQNCDIVIGGTVRIRPDGTQDQERFAAGDMLVWRGQEALVHLLHDHPAAYAVWGKLYRAELAKTVSFAANRHIHEDSFYLFELFLREPETVIIESPVVCYYLREKGSFNLTFSEKFRDILYFANRKYEIIEKMYPQYLSLAKNVKVKASLALLNSMRMMDGPEVKELEKTCIQTVRDNSDSFKPAVPMDRVRFWVARLGLQGLYKWCYRFYIKLRRL